MTSLFQIILIIVVSGIIGGFISGMFSRGFYKIRLPFSGQLIELGIFGDLMIGGVAGFILLIFMSSISIPQIDLDKVALSTKDLFTIVFLGLIAGFSGIKIVRGVSKKLIKDIEDQGKKIDEMSDKAKIRKTIDEGFLLVNDENGDFNYAIRLFTHLLKTNPKMIDALLGRALGLKRIGNINEAIATLYKVIKINPNQRHANYNLACYKNLSEDFTTKQSLEHLEKAIEIFDGYKLKAKNDLDLKSLWENKRFIELTSN